jgi:hypothetical protein
MEEKMGAYWSKGLVDRSITLNFLDESWCALKKT